MATASSKKKKKGAGKKSVTPGASPQLKSKNSWELGKCVTCDIIFLQRDIDSHSRVHEDSILPDHCYIRDHTLHTSVENLTQPREKRREIYHEPLLVHPDIVQLCGLKMGHLACVTTQDGSKTLHPVVYCYSLPHLLSVNISVPAGTEVTVTPHLTQPLPASYVWLTPIDKLPKNWRLGLHLQHNHGYMCQGQVLTLPNQAKLRVAGIYSKEGLIESMQSLSLDSDTFYEISDETDFQLRAPTPILPWALIQGLPPLLRETCYMDPSNWPPGIMLWGPEGSGKYTTVQAIRAHTGLHCIDLREEHIYRGEDTWEKTMDKVVLQAVLHSPAIVIVYDIDILCPPEELEDEHLPNTLAMRQMFSNIAKHPSCPIMVLGVATDVQDVDPLLLTPDTIYQCFEMGPATDLSPILARISRNRNVSLSPEQSAAILENTSGWIPGDLEHLFYAERLSDPRPTADEIVEKSRKIGPVSMDLRKDIVPKVLWSDIGGMEDIKQILRTKIQNLTTSSDIQQAILLYGPPGCSKTLLAMAIATEYRMNFYSISGSDIVSKYLGDTQRNIVNLFKKAQAHRPAVIFFDEFDSLCMKGTPEILTLADQVTTALISEIKKTDGVLFIAATNLPSKLNQVFLNYRIFKLLIPLPDKTARAAIFSVHLRNMMKDNTVDIDALAECSEGFTGAEIAGICRMAAYDALFSNPSQPPPVSQQLLLHQIQVTVPGVTPQLLAQYQQLQDNTT